MQTIINHISKKQPLILLILGKNYISIILSYSNAFRTKITKSKISENIGLLSYTN